MSAVPALDSVPDGASSVSLDVLQDVLYDIIATGAVDMDVPIELVEGFLHAHAREPRGRDEFVAFFEKHGLSACITPTMLGVDAPNLMAPDADTGSFVPVVVATQGAVAPPQSRRISGPVLWSLVGAAGVLTMAMMFGAGYQVLSTLRAELRSARETGAAQQLSLQQLESRTAALQDEVSNNEERIRNVDDREMLLESLLPMPIDMPAGALTDVLDP